MKDRDQKLIFEAYEQGRTETYVRPVEDIKRMGNTLIGQYGAKGQHYGVSAEKAHELLDDQKPFLDILLKRIDKYRKIWTFYALSDKGPVLAQFGSSITNAPEEWHKFLTDPATLRVNAMSLLGLEPDYDPLKDEKRPQY